MAPLTGRTAIVTGGSRGYGKGIAEALKESGASVWITGRDVKALRTAGEILGIHYRKADAASAEDWNSLIDEVMRERGSIDILINNAGGGVRIAPLDEQQDSEIEKSIAVNLTGAIAGCRRVFRCCHCE